MKQEFAWEDVEDLITSQLPSSRKGPIRRALKSPQVAAVPEPRVIYQMNNENWKWSDSIRGELQLESINQ